MSVWRGGGGGVDQNNEGPKHHYLTSVVSGFFCLLFFRDVHKPNNFVTETPFLPVAFCFDTTMNKLAIDLSNEAVVELQTGNMLKAFELISMASEITMNGVSNHIHLDPSENSTYRFHWVDCSAAFSAKTSSSRWEGCSPFLFLRGLRVAPPSDVDAVCPCGFAWAVFFNLAIVCSLIGTRLGERGQVLLKTAFDMYNRVQRRLDSEGASRHWNILQMAVTNNMACIYHDFAMREHTEMCLQRLSIKLDASTELADDEREGFFLNLQILRGQRCASAA